MDRLRTTTSAYRSIVLIALVCVPYGGSLDNRVVSPSKMDVTDPSTPQPPVNSGGSAHDTSRGTSQNASYTTQAMNRVFVWTHNKELYPTDGKRIEGYVFMQTDNKYANTQCAMECLRHQKCRSFNFASKSGVCQLNSASHLEKPDALMSDENFEYHMKASYSIDEVKCSALLD